MSESRLATLMEALGAIAKFEQKGELPGRTTFTAGSLAEAKAIMEAHRGNNL